MMTLNLDELAKTPIEVHYSRIWQPDIREYRTDLESVYSVNLGLSAEDWCRIAMREGDSYVGGCCGNTSVIQDTINGIFRDGGRAEHNELWELGEMCKGHPDGFDEDFIDRWSQAKFNEMCQTWEELEPWQKIAVSWQAVRDMVKPSRHAGQPHVPTEPRPDLDDKRAVDELYGAVSTTRFDIFRRVEEDDKWKSRHAGDILTMSKLFIGAKALLRNLEGEMREFQGYAIVEKDRPDVIVHNGFGACIYFAKQGAEEMFECWRKSDDVDGRELPNRTKIRPVTISVQRGLEFK